MEGSSIDLNDMVRLTISDGKYSVTIYVSEEEANVLQADNAKALEHLKQISTYVPESVQVIKDGVSKTVSVKRFNSTTENEIGNEIVPVNWSHEMTLMLLDIRSRKNSEFLKPGCKKHRIWKDIASKIQAMGHPYITGNMCYRKWSNLLVTFRRIQSSRSKSKNERKLWEYYSPIKKLVFSDNEKGNHVDDLLSTDGLLESENELHSSIGEAELGTDSESVQYIWYHNATAALINIRTKMDLEFRTNSSKKTLWLNLASKMRAIGHREVTGPMCSTKYKNLRVTYNRIKRTTARLGTKRSTWEFFEQMKNLLSETPIQTTTVEEEPLCKMIENEEGKHKEEAVDVVEAMAETEVLDGAEAIDEVEVFNGAEDRAEVIDGAETLEEAEGLDGRVTFDVPQLMEVAEPESNESIEIVSEKDVLNETRQDKEESVWNHTSVSLFLHICTEVGEIFFRTPGHGRTSSLWVSISTRLQQMGFKKITATMCYSKWKNLKGTYQRIQASKSVRPSTWEYYPRMKLLLEDKATNCQFTEHFQPLLLDHDSSSSESLPKNPKRLKTEMVSDDNIEWFKRYLQKQELDSKNRDCEMREYNEKKLKALAKLTDVVKELVNKL